MDVSYSEEVIGWVIISRPLIAPATPRKVDAPADQGTVSLKSQGSHTGLLIPSPQTEVDGAESSEKLLTTIAFDPADGEHASSMPTAGSTRSMVIGGLRLPSHHILLRTTHSGILNHAYKGRSPATPYWSLLACKEGVQGHRLCLLRRTMSSSAADNSRETPACSSLDIVR